jgi:hypothetical protein
MKYEDGSDARVGDRVRIRNGDMGVIVVSVDSDEFAAEYPKSQWLHLESGVLVRTDKGALVRFADPLDPGLLVRLTP